MSMEQSVCDLVKQHWNNLYSEEPVPDSLIFLKVAGKTSPSASIIAMILDGGRQRPVAIAKIPRNPKLTLGLDREYRAMVDLEKSISEACILDHIPCRGTLVLIDGIKILLQAAGTGHSMVREMTSRESVETLYERILPWMFDFHAHGAEECILAYDTLLDLVETPIVRFMEQFGDILGSTLSDEALPYLHELPKKVEGRTVRLCRQHGDFNAHNTLVKYDDGRLENFTLIDWEDYRTWQLPIHDLNHFFTSNSHLLADGMSPVESYTKIVLSDGWYRDLYVRAVADYELRGLIDRETFWILVPLYFIEMCFRIAGVQREQQDTALTWVKRMNAFITRYLRKVE